MKSNSDGRCPLNFSLIKDAILACGWRRHALARHSCIDYLRGMTPMTSKTYAGPSPDQGPSGGSAAAQGIALCKRFLKCEANGESP
jgi:hypothetical protein